jgi:hypothetical protein
MSITSNHAESEFSKGSLPVKRQLVEKLAIDPDNLKNDESRNKRLWSDERAPLILATITFCIGVTATLAWNSYGDGAKETIARSFPGLDWLAPQAAPVAQKTPDAFAPAASAAPLPDQRQLEAISRDLDTMRRSVEQLATSIAAVQEHMTQSVDRIVASQEQMARTVDQLAAGQERVTREISKLQAIEQQYGLSRNSRPPVLRQSQTPTGH